MGMEEVEDVKKSMIPIIEESREKHRDAVLNFPKVWLKLINSLGHFSSDPLKNCQLSRNVQKNSN